MTESKKNSAAMAALEQAKGGLSKLPMLGPALWLCAKDPVRKFRFVGDIDGLMLPPIVLDQCRLYTKDELPYAYISWAKVNDYLDKRLSESRVPRLAPHEWNSGEHIWLMDIIAPFGQMEGTVAELCKTVFAGQKVNGFVPDKSKPGVYDIQVWASK